MTGNVDRLLEAIRQRALVRSGRLRGKVGCVGSHDPLYDGTCYICGAAL